MRVAVFLWLSVFAAGALSQPVEPVLAQARAQKEPLLATLKELVSIESGSRDFEGLERIGNAVAARFKQLGAQVERVEPSELYKMEDTPERIGRMVRATFAGSGKKRILLIAHMDTVYPRGLLEKQPFRVEGDRAYGLGIADLVADAVAEGGGTDAAFAALKTKNAVLERFGLRGFGAHSSDDEYVLVSSIEPRLYLAARLIMDLARDRIR